MKTSQPDLLRHLPLIAAQTLPAGTHDRVTAARTLSGGRVLNVWVADPLTPDHPSPPDPLSHVNGERGNVSRDTEAVIDTPSYAPERAAVEARLTAALRDCVVLVDDPDEADIALVVHTVGGSAYATAKAVEAQVVEGRRVALLDLSRADGQSADPDLLIELTGHTSVYISNLAAYDVDLERALCVALTPQRAGSAHRLYMVETMLYYWAWQSIVVNEVRMTFGDSVPDRWMLRATTQSKSRLGAYLMKLRARGLRYFVRSVGFKDNRVDGFWFDLEAEG